MTSTQVTRHKNQLTLCHSVPSLLRVTNQIHLWGLAKRNNNGLLLSSLSRATDDSTAFFSFPWWPRSGAHGRFATMTFVGELPRESPLNGSTLPRPWIKGWLIYQKINVHFKKFSPGMHLVVPAAWLIKKGERKAIDWARVVIWFHLHVTHLH